MDFRKWIAQIFRFLDFQILPKKLLLRQNVDAMHSSQINNIRKKFYAQIFKCIYHF